LESVWGKPSISDAGDVVEGHTTSRKSGAQLAVMEDPPKSDGTRGRLKTWAEKDFADFSSRIGCQGNE